MAAPQHQGDEAGGPTLARGPAKPPVKKRTRSRPSVLHQSPQAVTWARQKAGLTKRALARQIGISEQLMSEIESGWRSATPTNLLKIAAALNCPLVALEAKIPGPARHAHLVEPAETSAPRVRQVDRTSDVPLEFGLLTAGVGEAFTAWRKGLPGFGEELADIVIYAVALAEMNGIDLDTEVANKIEKITRGTHKRKEKGVPVRTGDR